MGRERQKRKNRSSISKSRPKDSRRTKAGKRKVDFGNNDIIAKNWDRRLTLSQNYRKLGLSTKLGGPTGGTEKHGKENQKHEAVDSLAIPSARRTGKLQAQEVQVERDPETGRILKVIRSEVGQLPSDNPLNDPLNDIMDLSHEQTPRKSTGVVAELEKEAMKEEEALAKKRPRQQSSREEEWMERLVQKHGENTKAMSRDRKLNPMQQTEGDISRRLRKWKQKRAEAD